MFLSWYTPSSCHQRREELPEGDDEDPDEDPADYTADGGDDDDDEDESSDDDEDDNDFDIEEDEEEEEHLTPVDSTTVAFPAVEHAPSAEETQPFMTDEYVATPPPHPAYSVTARIYIRPQTPVSLPLDTEVSRLLAIPTPPPSPLSPWSSPLPQIPSPPLPPILSLLPVSSPLPVSPPLPLAPPQLPVSPTYPLGYRAVMIRLRAEAPSTSHSPPPHIILSHTRADTPPSGTRSERARLPSLLDLLEVLGQTMDEMLVDMPGAPATDDTELGRRMIEFTTLVRHDTDEIYTRLDDEQTERQLMTGRLNMLYRDRRAHARTALLMEREREREARISTPAPTTTNTTFVTNAQLQAMIDQGVIAALAARDANRSTNDDDSHVSGTAKEGVVELIQWFEKMEIVFSISNCSMENQIKFSTCTLFASALTWWKSHVRTVGHDVAYAMTWTDLKKKMTDKYCSRVVIKKLEAELWNLKVKGTDVIRYNQRFQELALLCVRTFHEESDKIERYVGGLPDMIHGSVVASKPKIMQEAIKIETELMDKKIRTFAKQQTENKRKRDDNHQQPQQQQNKRQNTGRAYTVGSAGNGNASAKVYAVGRAGTNPDSNVVTGTFLLNNRYASVLFDTGDDISFMSTAFRSQIDITPSTLDHYYDVELADGRIIGLNDIIRGCTLNFLNHTFNIDLMPVELCSFDAIIGMDWLAKYQAIIVCAKKIVRIP
ncbi:putative reverse transcriptase domain-containing protein [Tanacetum coccineum]